MGAFRTHAGLRGWGPAPPQGQLMVMSSSVRSLTPLIKDLKKMHQETKVRARAEVLVYL